MKREAKAVARMARRLAVAHDAYYRSENASGLKHESLWEFIARNAVLNDLVPTGYDVPHEGTTMSMHDLQSFGSRSVDILNGTADVKGAEHGPTKTK